MKYDWPSLTFSSIANDIPLTDVEFVTSRQHARDQLQPKYIQCCEEQTSACWIDYHEQLSSITVGDSVIIGNNDYSTNIRVVIDSNKIDEEAIARGLVLLEGVQSFDVEEEQE